ncbi:MAG: beta-xylosidase [Anaerolineae bacterium]|nr:beta-xylosidase [Anaerolineae bacterium]
MTTTLPQQARIRVDAGTWLGELPHNWNYIGYDEINYTYTPAGRDLLGRFMHMQEKPYYVRAHHLLCTGNGHGFYKWGSTNAYLEAEDGTPLYDWTLVDLVLDTILTYGCKPFVELGFMPLDLADTAYQTPAGDAWTPRSYQAAGFACPPKDYAKWYDLIFNLVRHCVERCGVEEIRTWYWELWNEPDLDYYWKGSIDDYIKLYDYTAAAVKNACPEARVGGPGTTNPVRGRRSGDYLDQFLNHCASGTNHYDRGQGTALDFVSFHVKGGGYRADPLHRKQPPPSVQQIVRDVQTGHEIIQQYPPFEQLECVLSEIDPDGWAAGGAWDNINLNFRNTEYYPSFVAAAFDKVSRYARQHDWDVRLLSWAFLFVGERCFEGTRAFSTQGIDKAIFNLFRMYAHIGHEEVVFESSGTQDPLTYADKWGTGAAPDLSGFATLSGGRRLAVLIYQHHDDWDLSGDTRVDLTIENLSLESDQVVVTHYRIDQTHSNAYGEWVRQGKPMYPTPGQRECIQLREGLEMIAPPQSMTVENGRLTQSFTMPVHAISLILVEPAP